MTPPVSSAKEHATGMQAAPSAKEHATGMQATLSVEIQLEEKLDERWAAWFDGLTLSESGDGRSRLAGRLPDRAALHGVLDRIRDLNLRLISVLAQETPQKEEE